VRGKAKRQSEESTKKEGQAQSKMCSCRGLTICSTTITLVLGLALAGGGIFLVLAFAAPNLHLLGTCTYEATNCSCSSLAENATCEAVAVVSHLSSSVGVKDYELMTVVMALGMVVVLTATLGLCGAALRKACCLCTVRGRREEIGAFMCVCMCVCVYICMYVCVCVCVSVSVYVYA